MAALARYGAETGAAPSTGGTSPEVGTTKSATGTVEIDSTKQRTGGRFCTKCGSGAAAYLQQAPTTVLDRSYYLRAAFRLSALPAANVAVARIFDATGTLVEITVTSAGKVELWNPVQAAHPTGESIPTIGAEEWHVLNVMLRINTAGKGKVTWLMDGVSRAAEQEMTFRNAVISGFRSGNVNGASSIVYLDDIAINDDQGAAQNTHPSYRGRIVLLKPVAQKSRVGFTGGGGATTNLHEALDNTPPTGAASPGTNASQIGSANNNSTDNLELTLAKYTDTLGAGGAGMGVSDPLLVLWGVLRGGQSSATGRGLGLTGVSNPVIAEKTDGLNAEVAAAEPTGWRTGSGIWGNFQYAPAIAYEEGPVIKVRKSASTTDNVMADLAGLMVEYEPEVAPQALKRELADTATATEGLVRGVGKALAESLTGSDIAAKLVSKLLPESIAAADAVTKNSTKGLADGLTGADALGPKAVAKVLAEAVTGSDTLSRALSKRLADSATGSEGISRAVQKKLADGVSGADSVQTFYTYVRTLAETVTGTEALQRFFGKRIGEAPTGTDSARRAIGKVLADNVLGTDDVRRSFTKRLAETVSALDAVKARIIQKAGTYLRFLGKWVKVK